VRDVLLRDEGLRVVRALAVRDAWVPVVRGGRERLGAQEISMRARLAVQSAVAREREDSRERQAVMDSNSVSVLPVSPKQLWDEPQFPASQP
jgi:hypothetical protein